MAYHFLNLKLLILGYFLQAFHLNQASWVLMKRVGHTRGVYTELRSLYTSGYRPRHISVNSILLPCNNMTGCSYQLLPGKTICELEQQLRRVPLQSQVSAALPCCSPPSNTRILTLLEARSV